MPVRKQPGQELLVLQLQARLLQFLEPGSTLYPVDSELDLKWPIECVDRAVPDESPDFRQQREQLFTGADVESQRDGGCRVGVRPFRAVSCLLCALRACLLAN